MLAATQAIVEAYETLGMTPEEIAQQNDGLDVGAVKTCLLAHSPKFNADNKSAIKAGEKPLFDQSNVEMAKMTMVSLMMGSEVDAVRLRAAKFVIDEVKGRNDVNNIKEASKGINIVLIHQQMARAREAKARSLGQTINVETTVETATK